MQTESSRYEKHINQIQFLRKQVSGEKLSHENTLKQLQSSYQIIDEMKEAMKVEQNMNNKLKAQLISTTNKLASITQNYEIQISQIKELIAIKDEQLRRINSFVMVNDADIIRLKVINEVQLTHKEQIEKFHHQISRKNTQVNELTAKYSMLQKKIDYLQSARRNQSEEHKDQIQQINNKYLLELKLSYQKLEKQRCEHTKWVKKFELLENKFNKQAQSYKYEIQKLNSELHNQNKLLLSNNEFKSNKYKIEKLEQMIAKLKEQVSAQKSNHVQSEEMINKLKKQIRGFKKTEQDWQLQRQKYRQQIEQLRQQVVVKTNQFKKQLQLLSRQLDEKNDHNLTISKEGKQKLQNLQLQNKRLAFKVKELSIQGQALKQQSSDKIIAILKKDISSKEGEILRLQDQIKSMSNKLNDKKRTASVYERHEDSKNIKGKLQQANDKIVELLKQKIELKKQINLLNKK